MSERDTGTKQEDAGALLGKAAAQIGEQSAMLLKLAQRHGEAISQTYWTELQRRLADLAALAPPRQQPARAKAAKPKGARVKPKAQAAS